MFVEWLRCRGWYSFSGKALDDAEEKGFLTDRAPTARRERSNEKGLQGLLCLTVINILMLGASIFLIGLRWQSVLFSDKNAAARETSYYCGIHQLKISTSDTDQASSPNN